MKRSLLSGDNVAAFFVGLTCAGIGLVAGTITRADAGDTLAFAGGLIGAGASVWGAFAVVQSTAQSNQREAETLFRKIVQGVRDDIEWMIAMSPLENNAEPSEQDARRIDSITSGVPQTADFLQQERLGSRSGNISLLAAELRFKSAIGAASASFSRANDYRNRKRLSKDMSNIEIPIDLKVLEDLLHACEITLGYFKAKKKPRSRKSFLRG